ncbi:serine/threonine-protein kinase, partial [Actinoallomurus acaciae]
MNNGVGMVLADRYQILGPLGRGGMGAVWRARDTDLDRLVAIKELRLPDQVGDDERRVWYARMEREARATARLRHPGIVTVYERVVGDDGRPWIVMELIQGGSLQDVLRRQGRLPAPQVAAIGRQVLAALSAAHGRGIVHRDIKPANVLLEGDRAVLTDFGIAMLDGDVTLTHTGAILGTPAFMAPEQVRGDRATPRSDLWSLGATLYAAVEGHPPFSGPTHGSVFVAIATEDPAPPVHAGPLTEVLTGLLRKDPAERLTADAVRGPLDSIADRERPPGPRQGADPRPAAPPPQSPPWPP